MKKVLKGTGPKGTGGRKEMNPAQTDAFLAALEDAYEADTSLKDVCEEFSMSVPNALMMAATARSGYEDATKTYLSAHMYDAVTYTLSRAARAHAVYTCLYGLWTGSLTA